MMWSRGKAFWLGLSLVMAVFLLAAHAAQPMAAPGAQSNKTRSSSERLSRAVAQTNKTRSSSERLSRAVAQTNKRVALVIGIERYDQGGGQMTRLWNPVRDARALARLLRRHGYEVKAYYNLRRGKLLDALEDFRDFARGAREALVFYSGHGMALGGHDIIAPIDIRFDCAAKRFKRAVPLQALRDAVADVPRQVVILDSCRNTPLPQCKAMGGAIGGFRALGRAGSPRAQTLIANATVLGGLTSDGAPGAHSPFMKALLRRLAERPKAYFRDLLDQVSADVSAATEGGQVPEIRVQGGAPRI